MRDCFDVFCELLFRSHASSPSLSRKNTWFVELLWYCTTNTRASQYSYLENVDQSQLIYTHLIMVEYSLHYNLLKTITVNDI